jgi:hypothetical protein
MLTKKVVEIQMNKQDRNYSESTEEDPLLDPFQRLNIHEEPTLITSDTLIHDLWHAMEHFSWPTLCYRKLICGLQVADPDLSRLLYRYHGPLDFEKLTNIFHSRGHDIRIGTCQIRNEGTFKVIIVKERRQNRYIVHKLSDGVREIGMYLYHVQEGTVYIYQRLPNHFKPLPKGKYWIAGFPGKKPTFDCELLCCFLYPAVGIVLL